MHAEELHLSIRDADMTCLRFGTGPRPLVLIPGIGLTEIRTLAMVVPAAYALLCSSHTVYLMDRIQPLPETHSTRDMADDIAAAMDQLGLRDADIMGASHGGMIGQLLAASRPDLVHAMVLAASSGTLTETARATVAHWLTALQESSRHDLLADFFGHVYPEEYFQRNLNALAILERTITPAQYHRFEIQVKAVLDFDAADTQISCPVLVVGDKTDRVLTAQASIDLADRLGCELVLYDGYGHALYDTAPDFKQLMLDFYTRNA